MESKSSININLDHIEDGLQLFIDAKVDQTVFVVPDAKEEGEAVHQIRESFSYDYELSNPLFRLEKNHIVQPHTRKQHIGTISPNIYVGTLSIPVLKEENQVGVVYIEVQSLKAGYRDDYRDMLELITEKCTDLLMQVNSPVSQNFETEYKLDSKSLYQRFAFINSIISADEFSEAVYRIVSSPVTQWRSISDQKDIRNVRRFRNSNIKELITGSNRSKLQGDHYLRGHGLNSIPTKITSIKKEDSLDTPENRFIKFALERFLWFCSDIKERAEDESRLWNESEILENKLEGFLSHSVFKRISRPETLKLNSPVLQRKEGYREILRVYLMFDLAAKLVWRGGDDIYEGGKKDIATLYEYWLFFKLLELFQSVFDIEPKAVSDLFEDTKDGLSLQLKQGKHTPLTGVYDAGTRKLNVTFSYNRSFSGQKEYPNAGSWTTTMRPDYTLTIWPAGISEQEAEKQELIVHIHFDAKYKVANLIDLVEKSPEEELAEKMDNRNSIYKNGDLLKMHAYKDAIRRTAGAYILYPGDISTKRQGFHEIIPGLGAFPVRPAKNDDGTKELKAFILEVIDHFINRASQREKAAYRTYDIHKEKPGDADRLYESLPEVYGKNRDLIPDDTFVLVGYYKEENLEWIIKEGLYNARAGNDRGSLRLGPGEAGAKYLLLHSKGETKTSRLLKITETGPRIFSKKTLIAKNYPSEPTQDYYLVYKVSEVTDKEFKSMTWDITKLDKYRTGRGSALPFSVTLSELMRVRVKKVFNHSQ